VIPFVEALAERLSDLDPANASGYRQRLGRFLEDTRALDARIRSLTSTLGEDRSFLVQHPAWGWFAADYGLVQIALEAHAKEPAPGELISLIEEARAARLRVVFVQRGYSRRRASLIAGEIGAEVVELGPINATIHKVDEHVRVDIVHERLSPRARAWVELLGTLILLLPFAAITAYHAWGFFWQSWLLGERSPMPSGLPGRYVIKGVLFVALSLLALQAAAVAARSAAFLGGAREAESEVHPHPGA